MAKLYLFFLCTALGFAFASPVRAQAWQPSQVYAGYRTATVFLQSETLDASGRKEMIYGTGFVVHRGGYVLTASHVVPTDSAALKRLITQGIISSRWSHQYQYVPLNIIARLPERDLVLLRFKGTEILPNHIPVARSETLKVDLDTVVFALGFPQNEDLMVKEGRIDSLNADGGNWNTSAALTYGMSGGPMVDQRGVVVGVMKSGVVGAEALRYVIPITYARPLLDQAGVQYQDSAVVPSSGMAVNVWDTAFKGQIRDLASKTFKISDLKNSHEGLTPTSEFFTKIFYPTGNSKFVAAHLVPRSQSNASDVKIDVAADGGSLTLGYRLTSGPSFDRFRGWIDADLVATEAAK